ncbi:MAG TPA: lipoyl synthase [Nitrospirales bacterium]|nr:lipoyl synthase [Nitrospirales bacterium]HIN32529.1 lipoyl synthase [Nitrospirales bacterium]
MYRGKPVSIARSSARLERTSLPSWFRVRLNPGRHYVQMRHLTEEFSLHTICEEARCPNIWECWNNQTATLMILGEVCTRRCEYCSVTTGKPTTTEPDEPLRVAKAVERLGLRHVVITSPNRDDLTDGGSSVFAETIHHIRARTPECRVEVLIPDFKGDTDALNVTLDARPDILNHNIETVPRLFPSVRSQGSYRRSLDVLAHAKQPGIVTKSGVIVGMGELMAEVEAVMQDLRSVNCDMLTIGQYLQPTKAHRPVSRFYDPAEFEALRNTGVNMGFTHVESGPLVRSSYHAEQQGREVRH